MTKYVSLPFPGEGSIFQEMEIVCVFACHNDPAKKRRDLFLTQLSDYRKFIEMLSEMNGQSMQVNSDKAIRGYVVYKERGCIDIQEDYYHENIIPRSSECGMSNTLFAFIVFIDMCVSGAPDERVNYLFK